jgi:hypothetical protein
MHAPMGNRHARCTTSAVAAIDSPFAAIALIAAPALLTNAASTLALGTSNRFARTIDRSRSIVRDLEEHGKDDARAAMNLVLLARLERRLLLILNGLRMAYLAMGAFALSTLVILITAVLDQQVGVGSLAVVATALFGATGVAALAVGSVDLVRDTRLAIRNVAEESAFVRASFAGASVRTRACAAATAVNAVGQQAVADHPTERSPIPSDAQPAASPPPSQPSSF